MTNLGRYLRQRNIFLTSFGAVSFAGCLYFAIVGREDSFLHLNALHLPALDHIFYVTTFLGDGLFSVLVFLILLSIKRYWMSIQLISAYLFSGIAAQILKRLVEAPRPAAFFPKGSYQFFIDGVTHSGHNSFPSGHATSVFALATIFALNDGNNIRRIAYLIIAVVTGYSRIYLGQHFLIDVIAGATMGVVFGIIFYLVVNFVKSRRKRQQIMEENSYLFS